MTLSHSQSPSDRRGEPRLAARPRLSFKFDGQEHSGDAIDLGFGGVGIQTEVEIPDGTPLELTLGIPLEAGPVTVNVRGRVRWSLASMMGVWRYGIGFDALRPEQREVLARYLSR
jgi:hypothetical protein